MHALFLTGLKAKGHGDSRATGSLKKSVAYQQPFVSIASAVM